MFVHLPQTRDPLVAAAAAADDACCLLVMVPMWRHVAAAATAPLAPLLRTQCFRLAIPHPP
jgi:hypothetical protein